MQTIVALPTTTREQQGDHSLCSSHSSQGPTNEQDAVHTYLEEIGAIALLSADEERSLALLVAQGDQDAKRRLVEANLRLVVGIAKHAQHLGLDLEDLISEGNLGLLRAVNTYDPAKGRFSTYATWWIRQAIYRALDNTARTIRLPSYLLTQLARLSRIQERLFEEAGDDPSVERLASVMGRDPSTVQFMRTASRKVASLDVPISSHDSLTYADVIPDETLPAHDEELVETEEQQEHIREVVVLLSHLTAREQQVIRLRFGLDGERACTLAEIGQQLGLSRERVRQIQMAAMQKLRQCSRSASLEANEQQRAS